MDHSVDKSIGMLPKWQQATSQQPLSLMTINANPKRKEDLLTIRILESSERKMQLIKKLLTPEEYNAVASDLFNLNHDSKEYKDLSKQSSPVKANHSVPVQLERQVEFETDSLMNNKRLSLNESRLNLSTGTIDLQESLAKKREAIDFFFQNPGDSKVHQSDLAIELRSGYYMNPSKEKKSKVLKEPTFSLKNRLLGILGLIGISFDETDESSEDKDYDPQELEFERKHRDLNVVPYTARHNLLAMARRLKNDGQLNKILEVMDEDSQAEQELTNLVDLAKFHRLRRNINIHQQHATKFFESVGHFSAIHMVGPRPFNQNLPISQVLVYHPMVETFIRALRQRRRKELSSTFGQFSLTGSMVNLLKVNLVSIRIKSHPLMTVEEKLARDLVELQSQYLEIKESLKKLTKELEAKVDKSTTNEVKEILSNHLLLIEQSSRLKRELQERTSELESLRKEQRFNSSSLIVKLETRDINNDDLHCKLEKIIREAEVCQEILDVCKSYLGSSVSSTQEGCENQEFELNETGMEVTQDNRCPQEERERRKKVRAWLRSIDLRVSIGDRYQYKASETTPNLELYTLDLRKSHFLVPYSIDQSSIELQFQLYRGEEIGFLKLPPRSIAEKSIKLFTDSSEARQQVVELQFYDEAVRGELRFLSTSTSSDGHICTEAAKEFKKFIDNLYNNMIKTNKQRFEDLNTKLYTLINQVDVETLLLATDKEVNKKQTVEYKKDYFCLDPLVDHIDDLKDCSEQQKEKVEIQCSSQIRESLLTWRWLNELNHLIYLSNHENIKQFNFHMDESVAKFKSLPMKQTTSGYHRIEQQRSWAVDCLKEYEVQLIKVLKYEQERQLRETEGRQGQRQCRVEDLLQEPRLKVDFSGLIRLARRLMPRRKPHRPLMPQRKGTADRLPTQLMLTRHLLDVESSQELGSSIDRKLHGSLQLVVTIQQAANVPMRVVLNPNQASRSASPVMGTVRSPTPLGSYLAPPTTYVEAVFQRRQQTSSLSQGKQPTWNETLFFPVDFGNNYQQQLVDDFLQLNLYDYHCHCPHQAPNYSDRTPEQSTMMLMSSLESATQEHEPSTPQRVLASRQRVERHLLGSLRIPLTTLMSTGRIEGSFALNQPLILDNYLFEPSQQTLLASAASSTAQLTQKALKQTHMSLFITLDPPVTLPPHLYLPTGSHESQTVFEYARQWEQVMALCDLNGQHQQQARRASSTNGNKISRRHRHVRCLVLQRDAKYCLINRLLTPLESPVELVEGKSAMLDQMKALSRFVSLLSPLKHGLLEMRLLAPSLWFDSNQLINQKLGGPEEKAVILCNYFLHLGKCSALVMGDSIHEGRCVYVIVWSEQSRFVVEETLEFDQSSERITRDSFLTKLPIIINARSVQIWDPNLGKLYTLNDQLPLLSVGSIATVENVYANLQSQSVSPADTNYDIRFRHLWFPLFEHYNQAQTSNSLPITSLTSQTKLSAVSLRRQRMKLEQIRKSLARPPLEPIFDPKAKFDYAKLSEIDCEQLKANIERVIKAQLLKWRPDRPTYFNRTLSRLLADKLALFEGRLEEPDWRQELADSIRSEVLMAHLAPSGLQTRQVISCPLNLPYTSMKTILDSIFASGVQNADLILDPSQRQSVSSSQFLVACHVHPYPAQVVSVWLYVAAVVTTTNNRDMYSYLGVPS